MNEPQDHAGGRRITQDAKLLDVQQALGLVGVPVDFDSRHLHFASLVRFDRKADGTKSPGKRYAPSCVLLRRDEQAGPACP